MRARRVLAHVVAALVGGALGAGTVVGVAGVLESPEGRPRPQAAPAEMPPLPITPDPDDEGRRRPSLLLAWSPGGIPPSAEGRLERLPGVRSATTILASLQWMRASTTADGTILDKPPDGLAIPLEVAYVEPREYAEFVPPGERDLVLSLTARDALLAETSADLRRAEQGAVLRLQGHELIVAGIVGDFSANGYEVIAHERALTTAPRDRYVLLRVSGRAKRAEIERVVARVVGPGTAFRVRAQGETPFLRYGDAVLPQMVIKEAFGEFAARPLPDGAIDVDRDWVRTNVIEARVPILGQVTCHRALLPQMRDALAEIVRKNLDFLLDRGDYGGCFSPRFVNRDPAGRLSHHSWGIAFDVNVGENPFGAQPRLDARIVQTFEDHGFTWGGRWLLPDGMHFEWVSFP